jgi:hypothetical protein
MEILRELNVQRRDYIVQGAGSFEKDVIITFNYDVMLDYAMQFQSIVPNYCLSILPVTGEFKFLKLHGSTNWANCRDCKHPLQIVKASPIPSGHILAPFLKDGDQINFRMVTNVLRNTECENCKKKNTLEPIVIPPTWSKAIGKSSLVKVWEAAVNEIRNAFQIVVIGYSMPTTDTFFQYLLTLGLASNAGFHRVVVINRDDSDDLRQRYLRVFSRSLYDRGHLKFLPNKITFQKFAADYMKTVGGQVEWAYE